jgi:hypothetical protein
MAYTSSPFAGAQIDFSALAGIGQNIGQGYQRRDLAEQMKGAIGPDGSVDYNKMIAVIAGKDPMKAAALAARKYEADADTDYRDRLLGFKQAQAEQAATGGGLTPYQEKMVAISEARLKMAEEGAAKLSPNAAGSIAMMETGQQELDTPVSDKPGAPTARALLSDPSKWKQSQQAQSFMPEVMSFFGQSDVVNAQSAVRTNVEAALRMMTGAAAPAQEVDRYASMFMPTWNDTKERAEAKLRRLDEFTKRAVANSTRGRGGPTGTIEAATPHSAPTPRRVPTMSVSPDGSMIPTQANTGGFPNAPTMMPGAPQNPRSSGPLPVEPDPKKRVIGQVYVTPDGKQYLWAQDAAGVGWEPLDAPSQ